MPVEYRIYVAVGVLAVTGSLQASEPEYSIDTLGLTDATHTRSSDGAFGSSALGITANGSVVGSSKRFDPWDNDGGNSIWIYDGTSTVSIGLDEPIHTQGFTQHQNHSFVTMNSLGHVVGRSERYGAGTDSLGLDVWVYDGSTTTKIGLTDADHSCGTNCYVSFFEINGSVDPSRYLNDNGQVIGYSPRTDTHVDQGDSAWFFNGTSTIKLGLTDAEHSRSNGYQRSRPLFLNSAGLVVGTSLRSLNTAYYAGETIWLYDGTDTIIIGLNGPEYTGNEGFRQNIAVDMNEAGQVLGMTATSEGLSGASWLYDGTTTTDIGPTGEGWVTTDGTSSSNAVALNEVGQILGTATRWDESDQSLGGAAWLRTGATVIDISPANSEYSCGTDTKKISTIPLYTSLNEAGQAIGGVYCSLVSSDSGKSIWLYDGTATKLVNPTDAAHTDVNGRHTNWDAHLNESGQVAGRGAQSDSVKGCYGWSVWFYDGTQTTVLPPLSTDANGCFFHDIEYFGEDGTILGWYRKYDSGGNLEGTRAYAYTAADGMVDLGLAVDDSFTEQEWSALAAALERNADGQIVGWGTLTDNSFSLAYLLTPLVDPTLVTIDVLPGDAANQVYPNKTGRLPVAILGSAEFDATQVDPATLKLGAAEAAIAKPVTIANVDSLFGDDTVARFSVPEAGILCNDTEVTLSGETYAGEPITGTDTIDATQCETGGCHTY